MQHQPAWPSGAGEEQACVLSTGGKQAWTPPCGFPKTFGSHLVHARLLACASDEPSGHSRRQRGLHAAGGDRLEGQGDRLVPLVPLVALVECTGRWRGRGRGCGGAKGGRVLLRSCSRGPERRRRLRLPLLLRLCGPGCWLGGRGWRRLLVRQQRVAQRRQQQLTQAFQRAQLALLRQRRGRRRHAQPLLLLLGGGRPGTGGWRRLLRSMPASARGALPRDSAQQRQQGRRIPQLRKREASGQRQLR